MRLRWILLLAFAVRVAVVIVTKADPPTGDAADFDRIAASLAHAGAFPATEIAAPGTATAYRPPLYPLALGGLYDVFGVRWGVARLFGAGLGTVSVFLVHDLARRFTDRARLVALVAALAPTLVFLSGALLAETLFVPLVLALACVVARYRDDRRVRWCVLAGGLLGLATLTRTNGIVLAVPVLVAVGLRRDFVVVALAALLVLVPWTVRNQQRFGALLPLGTQSGYTMAGQWNEVAARPGAFRAVWQVPADVPALAPLLHRPGTDEAELDAQLRDRAQRFARHHPGHVAYAGAVGLTRAFDLGPGHTFVTRTALTEMAVPRGVQGPMRWATYGVLLLILAGGARHARRRRLPPLWLLLFPAVLLISGAPWAGSPRYALPGLALLAVLA